MFKCSIESRSGRLAELNYCPQLTHFYISLQRQHKQPFVLSSFFRTSLYPSLSLPPLFSLHFLAYTHPLTYLTKNIAERERERERLWGIVVRLELVWGSLWMSHQLLNLDDRRATKNNQTKKLFAFSGKFSRQIHHRCIALGIKCTIWYTRSQATLWQAQDLWIWWEIMLVV